MSCIKGDMEGRIPAEPLLPKIYLLPAPGTPPRGPNLFPIPPRSAQPTFLLLAYWPTEWRMKAPREGTKNEGTQRILWNGHLLPLKEMHSEWPPVVCCCTQHQQPFYDQEILLVLGWKGPFFLQWDDNPWQSMRRVKPTWFHDVGRLPLHRDIVHCTKIMVSCTRVMQSHLKQTICVVSCCWVHSWKWLPLYYPCLNFFSAFFSE